VRVTGDVVEVLSAVLSELGLSPVPPPAP
jgi:hypothetical protein